MEWNLTAQQLQNESRSKSEYLNVFNQCLKTIQNAHNLNKTWAILEIPAFILGKPFYDQDKCVSEVCKMLKSRNFAFQLAPNVKPPHVHIFVSWAIIPTTTTTRKRSKRKENNDISGSSCSNTSSNTHLTKTNAEKTVKRVMFDSDVLNELELTYKAMQNSGKLSHLQSFKK
jgi:hypothetical protein